ncbi:MAG: hypothetical protein HYZ57_11455 [Acidobacteria bacterium]|nr:hypothetical protein [Acidobacteriota bacterium]MBI3280446.1 hypothetical protein [Acidobacteriota bacterium]
MGVLTDHMTQMCNEILAMRHGRRMLNTALGEAGAQRKNIVSQMCAGFARARVEMAHQTSTARHAFLKNLRQGVNRHRREVRADLMGARRAWMGRRA